MCPLPSPGGRRASEEQQTLQGQWKDLVEISAQFSSQELPASVEGDRLMIASQGMDLVF